MWLTSEETHVVEIAFGAQEIHGKIQRQMKVRNATQELMIAVEENLERA